MQCLLVSRLNNGFANESLLFDDRNNSIKIVPLRSHFALIRILRRLRIAKDAFGNLNKVLRNVNIFGKVTECRSGEREITKPIIKSCMLGSLLIEGKEINILWKN